MPDGFAKLRKGEKRPVYGQVVMSSGTLTIAALPAPTATLYDANGAAVGGFSGVAVSGYDTGAKTAPRVWLLLDTAALNSGFYTLSFVFTASGSDGSTRIYKPNVGIQVLGVTE
jgi:hypothetical protein